MLVYIMLYIMLDYLMLDALCNADCLNSAFLPLNFASALYFHALSWFIDTVCLFNVSICIMRSVSNLLVFHYSMFTPFLIERAMYSLEK